MILILTNFVNRCINTLKKEIHLFIPILKNRQQKFKHFHLAFHLVAFKMNYEYIADNLHLSFYYYYLEPFFISSLMCNNFLSSN